ncbi:MAG TPA: hypothetical protein VK752_26940 [Bryobacteraceae bacterium]|jgi:hypothetical protein|nr:hypothetical protein [Bryobacteraceae bacterium]
MTYRNRQAVRIENDQLMVTVTVEGGHIAEIVEKKSGMNPLWTPPWPSIEPSIYSVERHPEYGDNSESKLLAGILGHNLCLDIFGPPSDAEYAAGVTVHGEASVAPYRIESGATRMIARTHLPLVQLDFEREIELSGNEVKVRETVTNLTSMDRPLAWTQHVTLGPPFLEPGVMKLDINAPKSMVFPGDFGDAQSYKPGALFDWPDAPNKDGSTTDLRMQSTAAKSAGVTCHVVDPGSELGSFEAFHPPSRVLFGYSWKRTDFPWVSLWEENRSRTFPPWNGKAITRGVEFGVSPFAEGRRAMVDRGTLLGVPTYRWLGARENATVHYTAFARIVN